MNRRRQAFRRCLDSAVIVVIEIFNEFSFEVFHGFKILQIQQLAFEQPKKQSGMPYSTLANPRYRGTQLLVDTIEWICKALIISMAEFFSDERIIS